MCLAAWRPSRTASKGDLYHLKISEIERPMFQFEALGDGLAMPAFVVSVSVDSIKSRPSLHPTPTGTKARTRIGFDVRPTGGQAVAGAPAPSRRSSSTQHEHEEGQWQQQHHHHGYKCRVPRVRRRLPLRAQCDVRHRTSRISWWESLDHHARLLVCGLPVGAARAQVCSRARWHGRWVPVPALPGRAGRGGNWWDCGGRMRRGYWWAGGVLAPQTEMKRMKRKRIRVLGR